MLHLVFFSTRLGQLDVFRSLLLHTACEHGVGTKLTEQTWTTLNGSKATWKNSEGPRFPKVSARMRPRSQVAPTPVFFNTRLGRLDLFRSPLLQTASVHGFGTKFVEQTITNLKENKLVQAHLIKTARAQHARAHVPRVAPTPGFFNSCLGRFFFVALYVASSGLWARIWIKICRTNLKKQ